MEEPSSKKSKHCCFCRKEFDFTRSIQKYCSYECRKKAYQVTKICSLCQKEFVVEHKSSNQLFCSNGCSISSRANLENICVFFCKTCNIQCSAWNSQKRKFCSQKCSRQLQQNKSKWFTIEGITCQGTWELAFVNWALQTNLEILSDRRSILYVDDANETHAYHPDFWVPLWESFVDIKSDYTKKFSTRKFELLSLQHPEHKIKVLANFELQQLGVDFSYKTRKTLEEKYGFK